MRRLRFRPHVAVTNAAKLLWRRALGAQMPHEQHLYFRLKQQHAYMKGYSYLHEESSDQAVEQCDCPGALA